MASASPTAMSMALRPLIETLIRPVPVVPISRAGTPRSLARASTAPTFSAVADTTTRDADSENNVDAEAQAAGASAAGTSTVNPTPPVPNEHSASVTARPPSAQSCADRSSPSRARHDEQLLQCPFGGQIHFRRHPCDDALEHLQILAAAEFVPRLAEQNNRVAAAGETTGRAPCSRLREARRRRARVSDKLPGHRFRCRG